MLDQQWEKGQGVWVRTARPLGRGMEWLGSKGAVTKVSEAKRCAEGCLDIRKAVRGRWLEWVAEEGAYQHARGGRLRSTRPTQLWE